MVSAKCTSCDVHLVSLHQYNERDISTERNALMVKIKSVQRGWLKPVLFAILLMPWIALAGTTGKIAGRILDAATNEPLIGANVVVQNTTLGSVTDIDGYYSINNIMPGRYSVVISFLGYRKVTVTGVVVKIDLTTNVDTKLQSEAILGEEVVIRAERPIVQKDLTSSSVTISSDDLKRIPTENIGQVVNLQAGVVSGHFRGGRTNEVSYLIDGVSVVDPFNGQLSVEIDNSSIREMEVISGTFNAEYGQAMSGVVNVVTQEGSPQYHGSISMYTGDYLTSHSNVFPNVDRLSSLRTKNVQGNLSGPVPFINGLTFYATGRYFYDNGYLYGTRVYRVTDRKPVEVKDPAGNSFYIMFASGDSAYVPMNPSKRYSANGKLTYSVGDLKFSYSLFWDDNWNKYYDHSYAWTPDGIMNHYRTNLVQSFQITHAPSANTYQTFKFSYNKFDYKGYLYENPYDTNYVDPDQGAPISNYTFRSGGNQGDRYDRYSNSMIAQWSLSSQISRRHKISVGVDAKQHEIYNHSMGILNQNTVDSDPFTGALLFVLGYPNPGAPNNQSYLKRPFESSAYIQDKIEYDIMIINAGVRVDHFAPNASYPLDLRNPSRDTNFVNHGVMKKAVDKIQISPRLGISFPITDQGIIHFSYGHFFQIPSFENLYYNADYLITQSSSLSQRVGNPDLEPQRTVMYELGLQQVLFTNIGTEFTVYYRDIRNLLGVEIINTYQGIKYARFINRDYANVKGFILSLDKRFADYYGIRLDYTFQLARGNASDPLSAYYNNQSDPPVETNKKTVPLDWDQRSTLNLSVTVGNPGSWNVGLIMQYGSGWPYSEDVRVSNGVRFENGGIKPSTFNVDMRAEKTFSFNQLNFTVFALVYNLLDAKNEWSVNSASGRANIDLFTSEAGRLVGLNTIEQYVNNPSSFSPPRQLRLGITLDF
ncbi:MAG: TonB-dependent receptor [Ignavibacteriae bacterium]|nr:MAG: TonB-dependent receptor [Ignavibacteriota bacterium]